MKLNSLGGKRRPEVVNKVNPIGNDRRKLFPRWYKYQGE